MKPNRYRIDINGLEAVAALTYPAATKRAGVTLILGHGAGGNQESPFMVEFAGALAARGIDAITFNFLYSEKGAGAPDRSDKLEACWNRMVDAYRAGTFDGTVKRGKLAIGGKSMGGRIASQIAAKRQDVDGLVFLGYPLHPPGQPEKLRAAHLPDIQAPMLFIQGARDTFGTPEELQPILRKLKAPIELCPVEDGDHSFKVRKSAGQNQDDTNLFILDKVESWLRGLK